MLLLVDVGNTNTVFGLADPESGRLHARWRVASNRERTADEWRSLLHPLLVAVTVDPKPFAGAIVSSVVPAITRHLAELIDRHFGLDPIVVSARLDLGIRVATESPSEVGADRLVNSAYGYARFGGPLIVVDLGTATKIEAVTADGDYLGGVIAPGLGLSLDALAGRAARLYAVELAAPPTAIGRNTVAAMQSGVVLGHVAMVEGMIARVQRELGTPRHVVLTGGHSHAIAGLCPAVTDDLPDLALSGLHFLHQRNAVQSTDAGAP